MDVETAMLMPVDELALELLGQIADREVAPINENLRVSEEAFAALGTDPRNADPDQRVIVKEVASAYFEAWNWLVHNGLIRPRDPNADWFVASRRGKSTLLSKEPLRALRAEARLGVDLHPRAERARRQFMLGEFDLACFAAMREVEIRLRELIGGTDADYGTDLVTKALRPNGGLLVDPAQHGGEQEALYSLFRGAVGTFKNPTSHREVHFDDPIEAAEVVLFADLLLRILDRLGIASSPID
jgi:uncharacterized protein (TIGR02391 family)